MSDGGRNERVGRDDNHLGDLLSALADGALDATQETTARAHLDECAACRDEWEFTLVAKAAVRELPPMDLSDADLEAIIARVAAMPEVDEAEPEPVRVAPVVPLSSGSRRRARRLVAVAASAVSIAAAAVIVLGGTGNPDRNVAPPVQAFVQAHGQSTPGGDPISLAPLANLDQDGK